MEAGVHAETRTAPSTKAPDRVAVRESAPPLEVEPEVLARDFTDINRLGPALWVIGGLIAVVLLVLYPPTYAIGSAGWAVTALAIAIGATIPVWQWRHAGVFSPDTLLAQALVSLALLVLAQWLDGPGAPWRELLPLSLVAAALTQPARRAYAFTGAVALAAFAPLLWGAPNFPVAFVVAEVLVWAGITVLLVVLVERLHGRRVDLSLAEEAARHQARIDELTGLLNRRAFEEALADVVPEEKRRDRRATLLLIDLDGFKLINDRYGHLAGDMCLRAVGDALRASVRELDRCYRWGGDEFAVLLLDSSEEETATVAARIAERVTASAPLPDGSAPTLGCGWATLAAGMNADDLLGAADTELLRKKASEARERGVRSLTAGRRFAVGHDTDG